MVVFVTRLDDRRLDPADRPPWSLRQLLGSFYVNPRANPDFAWAFVSRFLLLMAYAFLVTYQAYYLIDQLGTAEDAVPHQIFLGTRRAVGGPGRRRTGDRPALRPGRAAARSSSWSPGSSTRSRWSSSPRRPAPAATSSGMAIGGFGFGMYMAVDLALVVDVLPETGSAAKDLGVLNIAGALPFALAPGPRAGRARRSAAPATRCSTSWRAAAPCSAQPPSSRSGGCGRAGHSSTSARPCTIAAHITNTSRAMMSTPQIG